MCKVDYLKEFLNGNDFADELDSRIKNTTKKPNKLYAVKRCTASSKIDDNYWKSRHKTMFVSKSREECKKFIENMSDDMWFNRLGKQYYFYIDTLKREENFQYE